MSWQVEFKETAKKDIDKLNPTTRRRLGIKIQYFLSKPNPLIYSVKLADSKVGQYRWRIGDYRVLFDVQGKKTIVLAVDHRREVYKK